MGGTAARQGWWRLIAHDVWPHVAPVGGSGAGGEALGVAAVARRKAVTPSQLCRPPTHPCISCTPHPPDHPPLPPQIRKMEADLKNLADNPQTTLLEGLHSVAYTGGLGRPLIVPDGCLGGLNAGAARGCLCGGWGAAATRRASMCNARVGMGMECLGWRSGPGGPGGPCELMAAGQLHCACSEALYPIIHPRRGAG